MKTINNTKFLDSITSKIKIATAIVATLSLAFSCRSTDAEDSQATGQASITLNVKDAIFEGTGSIENKASTSSETASTPLVQQNTIPLNKEFNLVAEFSQEVSNNATIANKATSQPNRAAADTTAVRANIRYKVVAYDKNGVYVTEKDYSRGSESTAAALTLDGGKNYTFVIYSVNSTSALPAITFANPANKTLATSSVNIAGNADFMYFKKNMTVSGSSANFIDVVFKHKLSQITTIIDATQTGYNITAFSSYFTQHNSSASITLADGTISRTGTAGNLAVTPGALNSLVITAVPSIINASNNNTSFTIPNITIGPLSETNLTPFTDLKITPGVKYNMKLTIVPIDINLTHLGVPAVRINGQIWMRHNLGVSTSLDADAADRSGSFQQLFGNYYQWGRNVVAATGATGATAPNETWNGTGPANANTWNSGTEDAPVKTSTDPCPTGWRIPTTKEWNTLIGNTTHLLADNQGTNWSASNTRFTNAKVIRSKRNYHVKLTFPAAGNYDASNRNLTNRASTGIYWSTQSASNTLAWRAVFTQPDNGAVTGVGQNNKPFAFTVRCIKQ